MIFKNKKKEASPKRLKKKGKNEETISSEEPLSKLKIDSMEPEGEEKVAIPVGNAPKLKKKEKVLVKKEKDDTAIMKKNTALKVMRVLLWGILAFVFLRGMFEILKPTKISEVSAIINDFKKEQEIIGDHPEELMKFAQDFSKEYLTYSQYGESDFKERIKPYVSKRIYNLSGIYSFKGTAKATYVNAYRKETYSNNQYDVYVNAEVQYEVKNQDTGEVKQTTSTSTLKVPVMVTENGYCIEGLPLYVADNRLDASYNPQEALPGTEIDKAAIEPAITNFLDAYYSQDQSMINYLLTEDADRTKFIGLSKRYTFEKLDSIHAYLTEENEIICILNVKIRDAVNEESIYQECNIQIIQGGDKYYIKDMNSKITTLN